jgi:hypothetical protein
MDLFNNVGSRHGKKKVRVGIGAREGVRVFRSSDTGKNRNRGWRIPGDCEVCKEIRRLNFFFTAKKP